MRWESGVAILPGVLGAAGILLLLWRRRMIFATTLSIPWLWSVLSIGAIGVTECILAYFQADASANWVEGLRFAAAATTFCPVMTTLGAKRPQDKPWQLIVISLWAILALPALEQLILKPGQPLEVQTMRSWFLLGMIMIGLFNFLPTRFWPSALLVLAAQLILLGNYLPFAIPTTGSWGPSAAMLLLLMAVALPAFGIPRSRRTCQDEDRLWLDFRDSFGLLWSLRMAERVNADAARYQWGITLTWSGFQTADSAESAQSIPANVIPGLHRTLKNLLRRFVSSQWIADRMNSVDESDEAER